MAEKQKKQYTQEQVHKTWQILMHETPAGKKRLLENMDPELITALRSYMNPYKKPIYMGGRNKMLAFSVINMTEKYHQRFAMTSLIGFIYRMLDEYKPDDVSNFMSEDNVKFAEPFNRYVKELKRSRPEENLVAELENIRKKIEELKKIEGAADKSELQKAAIDSFVIRAKLLKYRIYWTREDLTVLRERCTRLSADLKSAVEYQNQAKKDIVELERKRAACIEYRAAQSNVFTKRAAKFEESLDEISADEIAPTEEEMKDIQAEWSKKSLPEGMTIQDMLKKPSTYDIQITNRTKDHDRKVAEQEKMEVEKSQFDARAGGASEKLDMLNKKFKELREEFIAKTKCTSAQCAKHLDSLELERYDLCDEDYDAIAARVKRELNIEITAEEHTTKIQNLIEKFLDEYFRYNPDNHVRCAYMPNYADPQRTPLEKTAEADHKEKNYERTVIPPSDTFFRWKRYMENNYEPLRQATDDIYAEKSDFEFAIAPLEVFEGKTKEDVEKQFDKFKRKYATEVDAEIYSATVGIWNLLSSWEQNREVRDFYTERTEIIKRIIDQHKDDERMGMRLMKDRAKKKREENEKALGPHPAGLTQYREGLQANRELEKHGGKHISEIDVPEFITEKNVPRDTDESTTKELEVGVHVIRPYLGGGKRRHIRGEAEQWKFHIPTEEMGKDSMEIMTAPEFQKKYSDMLE